VNGKKDSKAKALDSKQTVFLEFKALALFLLSSHIGLQTSGVFGVQSFSFGFIVIKLSNQIHKIVIFLK
jgi:hypothetical protein